MNKRQLSLLIIIWIIVITVFSIYIFREESIVLEKSSVIKEVEKVDIVDDGKKLSILSFEKSIENLVWLNEDTIEFLGQKTSEDNKIQYSFDLNNQVLTRAEEKLKHKVDSSKKIIKVIDDNCFITTEANKAKGIYLHKDNEIIRVVENGVFGNQVKITISENKDKIAYYDGKSQKIKIYAIDSGKTSTINLFPDEVLLKNMDESVIFSPDAGYVVIYYSPEIIGEKYFSVYGADSGRLYSEKIWGINPTWAPEELKISYMYGEDVIEVLEEDLHLGYIGKRVGYYDLKSRKSIYTGAIMNKSYVFSNIKWMEKGNALGYHTVVLNETTNIWSFKEFNIYNIENKSFNVYENNFVNGLRLKNLREWTFNKNYYIAAENLEKGKNLIIHDLRSNNYDKILDCEELPLKEKKQFFKIFADNFMYKKENYLYLRDTKNSKAIVNRDGEIINLIISPNGSSICTLMDVNGKMIIDIVRLRGNVSVQ